MEFFLATQFSIPLLQVVLLLALSNVALLFGRIRLALLTNYVFILFWGYGQSSALFDSIEKITTFTMIYFGFGLVTVVLAAIGFLAHQGQS